MEANNSHDNINVKVNSRITVYGNVVMLSGASVLLVGFLFLAIWMHSYWEQAVTVSAIIVYGLVTAFFCVIVYLLSALWIKFVIVPGIDAKERSAELRARAMKDRVLWTQENCVVAEIVEGQIEVIPLFPHVLAAPTKEEPFQVDDATIIEMYKMGCTYETIMAKTGLKYHRVQRIISEARKRGEIL